MNHIKILWTS